MKKFYKHILNKALLLITLFIFSFPKASMTQNILDSIDLMPLKNKINLIELTFGEHNDWNNFFSYKLSERKLNYSKNRHFSIGTFTNLNNIDLGINLNFIEEPFSRTFIPKKVFTDNSNIDMKIIYPHNFKIIDDWKIYTNLRYFFNLENNFYCYETSSFIIGGDKFKCQKPSKTFYKSFSNGAYQDALNIKSKTISLGKGIRKTSYLSDFKRVNELGLIFNFNKNKLKFGKGFESVNQNYLNSFPLHNSYIEKVIKLSSKNTKVLNKNWSLGASFNGALSENTNNLKKTKANFLIDVRVTRNFNDKYFLALGGSSYKNYKIGFEATPQLPTDFNFKKKSFSNIYLKIGTIFKDSNNKKNEDLNFASVNEQINKKIKQKLDKENLQSLDKSGFLFESVVTTDKFKKNRLTSNKQLRLYAINFAKKYDESNYVFSY